MVFPDMTRTHTDFFLTKVQVPSSESTAPVPLGCPKGAANADTATPWAATPSNTNQQTLDSQVTTLTVFTTSC